MQQLQENALKSLGPEGGTPLLTELRAVTAWLFCCQINTIFCKVSAQGCTRMWRFLMDTSQRYLSAADSLVCALCNRNLPGMGCKCPKKACQQDDLSLRNWELSCPEARRGILQLLVQLNFCLLLAWLFTSKCHHVPPVLYMASK